jgi:hypothetical protein
VQYPAQRSGAEGEKICDVDPTHGDNDYCGVVRVRVGALMQAQQEGSDALWGGDTAGYQMGLG